MFGRVGREIFAAIYCTCTFFLNAVRVFMLTYSYDLRRWVSNCGCYHRSECRISPCDLYGCLRGRGDRRWVSAGQRPDTRQGYMAWLDRSHFYLGSNLHRHHIRGSTGPSLSSPSDRTMGDWLQRHRQSVLHRSFIRHLRLDPSVRRYTDLVSHLAIKHNKTDW